MADIVKLIYKGDEMAQGGGSASVDPATTSAVGTVRVATNSEWNNGTSTGSGGEYLLAPVDKIKDMVFPLTIFGSDSVKNISEKGGSVSIEVNVPQNSILLIKWQHQVIQGSEVNDLSVASTEGGASVSLKKISGSKRKDVTTGSFIEEIYEMWHVGATNGNTVTVTLSSYDTNYDWSGVDNLSKRLISGQYIRSQKW